MVLKSGKLRAHLECFQFQWAIEYKFVANESR